MLEDDLKLSSDEDESEQAAEKSKPRSTPLNGRARGLIKSLCETWPPALSPAEGAWDGRRWERFPGTLRNASDCTARLQYRRHVPGAPLFRTPGKAGNR
ncbi:hypothetical protein SKAU_G00375480 [Synaphobranchus kaupii]|uniref:Uncharacterized protein n=1 Tax=Synaphobranchus kaupii TaxID=118154 RepID=A0A9Q1IG76_SYNKA|nr:hypothetical protein SKAU_G00375480 [Synaphobranchus kaupii]